MEKTNEKKKIVFFFATEIVCEDTENQIAFENYYYSTIDFRNPCNHTVDSSCDVSQKIELPQCWELVPYDINVVFNVVQAYPWNSNTLSMTMDDIESLKPFSNLKFFLFFVLCFFFSRFWVLQVRYFIFFLMRICGMGFAGHACRV